MDNLAHKMLHTFEKMDPINPTFEYGWNATFVAA